MGTQVTFAGSTCMQQNTRNTHQGDRTIMHAAKPWALCTCSTCTQAWQHGRVPCALASWTCESRACISSHGMHGGMHAAAAHAHSSEGTCCTYRFLVTTRRVARFSSCVRSCHPISTALFSSSLQGLLCFFFAGLAGNTSRGLLAAINADICAQGRRGLVMLAV